MWFMAAARIRLDSTTIWIRKWMRSWSRECYHIAAHAISLWKPMLIFSLVIFIKQDTDCSVLTHFTSSGRRRSKQAQWVNMRLLRYAVQWHPPIHRLLFIAFLLVALPFHSLFAVYGRWNNEICSITRNPKKV